MIIRFAEAEDVEALAALEALSWAPALAADAETIRERFDDLGHHCVLAEVDAVPVAACSYYHTDLDPVAFLGRVERITDVTRGRAASAGCSTCAYNLCLHPAHRGGTTVQRVIAAALRDVCAAGIREVFGVVRCPSYAGAGPDDPESVLADRAVHDAINHGAADGGVPRMETLLADPLLRFYFRTLRCRYVRVIPGFLPGDCASGDHGVAFLADATTAPVLRASAAEPVEGVTGC